MNLTAVEIEESRAGGEVGGSRGEAGERAEARLAALVSRAEESELGPEGRGCKKSFDQGACAQE